MDAVPQEERKSVEGAALLAVKEARRREAGPVPLVSLYKPENRGVVPEVEYIKMTNAVSRARAEVQDKVANYIVEQLAHCVYTSTDELKMKCDTNEINMFILDQLSEPFKVWFEGLFTENLTVGQFYARYYERPGLAFDAMIRCAGIPRSAYFEALTHRFLAHFGKKLRVEDIENTTHDQAAEAAKDLN